MKKFHSRFEQVRRVRSQQEKLARVEASVRNAERDAALAYEAECQNLLQHTRQVTARSMSQPISGAFMASVLSEVVMHEQAVTRAQTLVHEATERVRNAMAAFAEARSELRTIQEMIHREQLEHRQQQLLSEEHEQQELASRQWHLNSSESERNAS